MPPTADTDADRDELKLEQKTTLAANSGGATMYFKKLFRAHPGFPLNRGDGVYAVTIPGIAVVLFPADDEPELPLEVTINDPDAYRLRTEPLPKTIE